MELQFIQSKIYEIRGQKVMLDRDLAELYGIETKRLKEAVRRNLRRFPVDFMFELNRKEFEFLRSQIAFSNGRGGLRYMPFAFTEQGVAMLSSVLNSDVAIEVNISIMRAFVAVRQLISNPPVNDLAKLQSEIQELKGYIEEVFAGYNDINDDTRMQIELINRTLAELQTKEKDASKPRNPIGFNTYKK
ncbi:ORF6N domain-containing protein [Bacteroides nordii]|jgi:hypothetical protein|uniref:ORF6N domain-containing protein n=1 Tax=Bacteroides nordii TaxID=291645 RepID=UPI001899A63F|nr:ORF6N domain-containing protein [Bacteroides nordii]